MTHRNNPALANPLVGIYFGIFAAGLAAIVVLLLIFEQLGATDRTLKATLAFGSISLFAAVGAGAYAVRMRDFASAGNRVPGFYNGLSLTVSMFGGVGLAGIAGATFLGGFDMLFLGLGLVSGLTVMVVLVAPFMRKFGAPTVPGFLGMRFESSPVRILAASVAAVPLLLVLIAEIKVAAMAAGWLTPLSPAANTLLVAAAVALTVLPGGVRSLSWTTATQAIAVLVAVLVPAGIAAVIETNLPFGQLSHGPLLRAVARAETLQGVPLPVAGWLTLDLPPEGLQAIAGRFVATFGSVGPIAFVLGALSVLAGVAGSPALLPRVITTPSVYETRRSIAWAVVLAGLLLTTFSAVAVFERHILVTDIVGQPVDRPPVSVRNLIELGLAALDSRQPQITASSLLVDRDATLVAMPVLLGLPRVVVSLVAAGILAGALAAAAASLTQLGLILGEDVVNGPESWRASEQRRLAACRIALVAVAALAAAAAALARGDPLVLMLDALALSGSSLFPVLVLSIWWKRTSAMGAVAGLATGFGVALVVIAVAGMTGAGLPALLAPTIAAPAAVAATMVVSNLTPAPGRHVLEMVRDLRIPGGETIYDRTIRQSRQRSAHVG